jgi:flagellar biosynthesis component FlhA
MVRRRIAPMKVFLSHSSADKPLARRLARDLREANVDVWLDEVEIHVGEPFAEKIAQALDEADFVIVLLTRASVASDWVDREWRHKVQAEAAAKRVAIIPVRGEPCDMPDFLAQRSHADISGGSYLLGLEHLLTILGHYAGDDALAPRDKPADRHETADMWWVVTPIALEVSGDLAVWFESDVDGRQRVLHELVPAMRQALHAEFGFPFPGVRIRVNDVDLPAGTAAIFVEEIPERVLHVEEGVDAAALMCAELHDVLRRMAPCFIDIDTTHHLIDGLGTTAADVVRGVVPARVSWFELTDVLRRLVDEGIEVGDIATIVAALAPGAESESAETSPLDTVVLTERARHALAPQITARFLGDNGFLRVLQLDREIENVMVRAIKRTAAGAYLNLAPDDANDILRSIRDVVMNFANAGPPPILVTNVDIRPFIRATVRLEFPTLHVLSSQDITPFTRIETVAAVTLRQPNREARVGGAGVA